MRASTGSSAIAQLPPRRRTGGSGRSFSVEPRRLAAAKGERVEVDRIVLAAPLVAIVSEGSVSRSIPLGPRAPTWR